MKTVKKIIVCLVCASFGLVSVLPQAQANLMIWDGGGSNANVSNNSNWCDVTANSNNVGLRTTDTVQFGGTGSGNCTTISTKNTNWNVGGVGTIAAVNILANGTAYSGTITQNKNLAVSGNFNLGSGIWDQTNKTLNIGGSFTKSGTGAFASAPTITFDSSVTGNTITSGGLTFAGATFNNASGGWILSDSMAVNNDLVVTAGALSLNNKDLTVNHQTATAATGITGAGTIFCGVGSTVCSAGITTFDAATGNGTVGGGAFSFYDLKFQGAGKTTTFGGNLTVVDQFVCGNATATVCATNNNALQAGQIFVYGDSITNSVFNAGSSAITTTLTNATSLSLYNLLYSPQIGTFNASSSSLTLAGTVNAVVFNALEIGGGTFNANTGTVTYTGSDPGISTVPYYNLIVNKAGSVFSALNNLTVNNALTVTAGNLNMGAYTLDINGNTTLTSGTLTAGPTITAAGSWTNNGATFAPGTGTVTFDGTGAQTISGTASSQPFYNFTVNKGSNSYLTTSGLATLDINGSATITAGTLYILGTMTITVAGDWTNNATFIAGSNGTVTFDGTGAQTISGTGSNQPFYNFTVNKGQNSNFTAPATLDINGTATLTAGTLTAGTTITVAGDWTNNSTFSHNSGTVTFDGTGAQTISGTGSNQPFYNFTVDKGSYSNLTAPTTLDINGVITLTAGTLTAGANVNVAGNWVKTGATFAPGTGTVTFDGTGTQTINSLAATVPFNNLTVNKGSNSYLSAASVDTLDINGSLTLTAGTLTAGTTITVAGDWTNNATFIAGSNGTVTFDGTGAQTISGTASGQPFYNFTLNKGQNSNLTAPATLDINGDTVLLAGTLTAGTTITAAGNWSQATEATFAPGSGTVTFDGTVAQTISGTANSKNFYSFTVNKGSNSNLTAPTTLDINGNTTLTAGTLTAGTTITVAGNWSRAAAATFIPGTGTVTFDGTGTQSISGLIGSHTFYSFAVNKGQNSNLTAPATLDINGDTTLTAGTLTASTTITAAGNWTNNGATFAPGTGTVTFDGTVAQTISGTAASHPFYHFTMNKAKSSNLTGPNALDINGNLTLSNGTLTSGANITVAGDWTHDAAATFAPGTGTVTFDGTAAQTINSANTWYGLSVTGSTARTVSFQSAVAQTIAANGSLTFSGASGQTLTLAPLTAASEWQLNVNNTGVTQSVSYVSASYSNASGGAEINANDGTCNDAGNNTNWNFGPIYSNSFFEFF